MNKDENNSAGNLLSRIKGKELVKIFERPSDIQRQEGLIRCGANFALKDVLVIPTKPGWGDWYTTREQLKKMGEKSLKIILNEQEFTEHLTIFEKQKEILFKELDKLIQGKKFDKKDLLNIYEVYNETTSSRFGEVFLIPLVMDEMLVPVLKEKLEKEVGERVEDIWSVITKPTKLTNLQKLQIFISELRDEGKLERELPSLVAKYSWISVYKPGDKLADAEYLKSIIIEKESIKRLKQEIDHNKKEFEDLFLLIKDDQLKTGIKSVNHYITFRSDRADVIRRWVSSMGIFYSELLKIIKSENASWEITDILCLTGQEITKFLNNDGLINLVAIKDRLKPDNFQYFADGDFHLITKKEDKDIIKKLIGIEDLSAITEFKGNIANRGYVKGKVKLINNPSEINKVVEGEIMVSIMTFPELMPAMKKASAFITDEGGITCHAAIIAREMNKPCIIATKIATQVLKDGDLVEVDADKGIIRIIK